MKTPEEIQRAHDLLTGVILGEVPSTFKEGSPEWIALVANCDVLCWLLDHDDHNRTFGDNLRALEAWLRARGYVLENTSN